jgi:hypothetical protein
LSTLETVKRAAGTIPHARLSPRGLTLDDGLDYVAWQEVGVQLGALASASAWWIGDWCNYGFWEYGQKYEAARDATGLAYQTLRNYASVCEAFDVSLRRDKLSFTHHAHVAGLRAEEQVEWLDRAEANGWSTTQLFEELRSARKLPPVDAHRSEVARPLRALAVEVPRAAQWQSAAKAEGLELEQWAAQVLDEAAATILTVECVGVVTEPDGH